MGLWSVMDDLAVAAFFALVLNTVTGLVLMSFLLKRLQQQHPSTWNKLGRPTLVMNNTIANGLSTTRFIFRREYEALGDPELNRVARSARWSFLVQTAALVILIAWMFFQRMSS